MCWIWLRLFDDGAPIVKPRPHFQKVLLDHDRRRDDAKRHPFPNDRAATTAKSGHARFCRYACPGQNENALRRFQTLAQARRNSLFKGSMHRKKDDGSRALRRAVKEAIRSLCDAASRREFLGEGRHSNRQKDRSASRRPKSDFGMLNLQQMCWRRLDLCPCSTRLAQKILRPDIFRRVEKLFCAVVLDHLAAFDVK